MEEKFKHSLRISWSYFLFLKQRIIHDRLTVSAGYMAYITLLSLVPLVTVLLSVLSQFPIFSGAGETVQEFVIQNFVPAASDAVEGSLKEFISNTGKMTAVGSGFLFVASVMLISAIDRSLNYIWRVKKKRRPMYSFSLYWMILTLGPLLVGASLAATSYVTSLKIMDDEIVSSFYRTLLGWLPIILSFSAFLGLYLLVPNKKIRVRHALIGAMSAGCLFEVSKVGFAQYITQFPSYEVIYGALAAVPILFVWIYLCWIIVLIGAEITASLGESDQWLIDKINTHVFDAENTALTESKGLTESDSTDPKSK
ncbi:MULTISPECIES: virulence factor BrkB family protein [Aliivibrio]|uniref:virulence factor BrkB family protein n=1 Tax=Aliivibrio TaxID=511678 RepID=UPI0015F940EC|nr:virulence factor BrkB family protein [Aliivibrio sp. SR45-2]MBB1313673.1 virulence factor BrkB family protein [Aliivibrio sp. SR45-2]